MRISTRKQKLLAIATVCGVLIVGPQIAMARGWGDVFDPTRFSKNTAIYTEKLKEIAIDSKVYANMIVALSKLAGINEANNKTLQTLQDYADSQSKVEDPEFLAHDYTDILSGKFPAIEKGGWTEIGGCFSDIKIKKNAEQLEDIDKHVTADGKLQKTVAVLLKMKADGTLGELQKGNYLDGLSTSQKLAKINRDIKKYQDYAEEIDAKHQEEVVEQAQNAKATATPAYDPYHPEKFPEVADSAKVDHYDAFGNKNYKSENLGFRKF